MISDGDCQHGAGDPAGADGAGSVPGDQILRSEGRPDLGLGHGDAPERAASGAGSGDAATPSAGGRHTTASSTTTTTTTTPPRFRYGTPSALDLPYQPLAPKVPSLSPSPSFPRPEVHSRPIRTASPAAAAPAAAATTAAPAPAAPTPAAHEMFARPAFWDLNQARESDPSQEYWRQDQIREGHLPVDWVKEALDGGVHFRELGTMVGSLDYGHIGFDVDLNEIRTQYSHQCNLLARSMKAVQTKTASEKPPGLSDADATRVAQFTHGAQNSMHAVCNKALARLDAVVAMFTDVSILQSNSKPRRESGNEPVCWDCQEVKLSRVPRQIFLAVGMAFLLGMAVTAIGSLLFSQMKLVDVSASFSAGSSDEEIEVLQEHERQTQLNKKAIADLSSHIAKLEARIGHWIELIERPIGAMWALNYMTADLDRIIDGVDDLSHFKMSHKLVNPMFLAEAVRKLQAKLGSRGITMLPKQLHEFYELDLSFLYFTNHTMRVILHVPAYADASLLTLYEYVPTPLQVGGKYLLPNPEARILAVDDRSSALFKSMTKADLSTCKHSGHKYFCPGQNFYHKVERQSCVTDLYLNRLEEVANSCRFQVLKEDRDFLVQLSPHEFILYHAAKSHISIDCKHFGGRAPESAKQFFQGVRRVIVPPGCTAQTNEFTFQGQIDIFAMEPQLTPHLSMALNLTEFLPLDVIHGEVDELIGELSKVGGDEGVKVRDLVTMLKKARTQRLWNLSLGVGGTLLAGFLLVLFLFCCCCPKQKVCRCPPRCPPWKRDRHQSGDSSAEEEVESPTFMRRYADLMGRGRGSGEEGGFEMTTRRSVYEESPPATPFPAATPPGTPFSRTRAITFNDPRARASMRRHDSSPAPHHSILRAPK